MNNDGNEYCKLIDNHMYVYVSVKKVLLAILMLTVGIYFLHATHSDSRREIVEFVKAYD